MAHVTAVINNLSQSFSFQDTCVQTSNQAAHKLHQMINHTAMRAPTRAASTVSKSILSNGPLPSSFVAGERFARLIFSYILIARSPSPHLHRRIMHEHSVSLLESFQHLVHLSRMS